MLYNYLTLHKILEGHRILKTQAGQREIGLLNEKVFLKEWTLQMFRYNVSVGFPLIFGKGVKEVIAVLFQNQTKIRLKISLLHWLPIAVLTDGF